MSSFLTEAIRLAVDSVAEGGGPFGAVVVRAGVVVGRGTNRVVPERDPTAHAEVLALREACRTLGTHDLSGATVYASCEPCPMCLGAILWSRASELVFAATRGDAAAAGFADEAHYEELRRPVHERTLPSRRVEHPGAAAPFRAWASNPGRRPY